MNIKTWNAALVALTLVITGAHPAGADPTQGEATQHLEEPEGLELASSGSSYVSCYFGTVSSHKWYWARAADNSVLSIGGDFKKGPLTGVERFFATSVSVRGIKEACERARKRKKERGSLMGAFAATWRWGDNYPIVIDGEVLYPKY